MLVSLFASSLSLGVSLKRRAKNREEEEEEEANEVDDDDNSGDERCELSRDV